MRSRRAGESRRGGLRYDFEGARRGIKGAAIGLEFAQGKGADEVSGQRRIIPDIEERGSILVR